jgi:hypothetical protein
MAFGAIGNCDVRELDALPLDRFRKRFLRGLARHRQRVIVNVALHLKGQNGSNQDRVTGTVASYYASRVDNLQCATKSVLH